MSQRVALVIGAGHATGGATASLPGRAEYAAFGAAQAGLRSVAQSGARKLAPLGIHVAHVVIDGAIDTGFIRTVAPQKYATKDQDGILNPDDIAETYWAPHGQKRYARTHELGLRPWSETW